MEKKEIDRDHNLNLYKIEVNKNISLISEDNLQEPKMNFLGPAIESSKYYFEEIWYREMFSKLIAASCDKSKNDYIHPAFVEVIKQLSPNDAYILNELENKFNYPLARYLARTEGL